jgi:hypothetical protein
MVRLAMDTKVQLEFSLFEEEVRTKWRYMRSPSVDKLLDTVKDTIPRRVREVAEGDELWRARLGNVWEKDRQCPEPLPYEREDMKPRDQGAMEGRANPKGIPCLYLSTHQDAAMAEMRPWVGALVSVAKFRTSKPLRIIDCALRCDEPVNFFIPPHGELEYEEAVWKFVDKAFAKPVTRTDDAADYAITQILAEIFRREGYDGIAFKSLFGEAYTIALFDLEAAEFLSCHLFTTQKVEHHFKEYDDHPK